MANKQELQAAHARNVQIEVTVTSHEVSQALTEHNKRAQAQEAENQIGSLTDELLQHQMTTEVRICLLHVSLLCCNLACLPAGMLCSIHL